MPATAFKDLASVCERIRATTRKLEKIAILSSFLKALERSERAHVCRFLSGYIFPRWSTQEVFVGYSALSDVIKDITELNDRTLSKMYLKYGDLGSVAEEALTKKTVAQLIVQQLDILTVFERFEKMASSTGSGSVEERKRILRGLLLDSSPLEAKYIVKILTGELRIGLVEGLVEEAVSKASGESLNRVREANLVTGDIGVTATLALEHRLDEAKLEPMHPTNFMLADTMQTAGDISRYFQKRIYAEFKYDGIRAQVHKLGDHIRIFSRRLEDVAWAFPDIVSALKRHQHDFVLDGEIVPFRDGRPLPFQILQKRLRRKTPGEDTVREIPLTFFVYDILFLDGRTLIREPLAVRRAVLEGLGFSGSIKCSHIFEVESENEISELFGRSKGEGYEGLVIKDPSSLYVPGRRGKHWVKLKKELDTLDVVIVAAEYGHGKRANLLSDYTFAVKDGNELKVVGKAYSGLTDKEILEMTDLLNRITIRDDGYRRIVKPQVVLEVAFDLVQRSKRHGSGFALRFPRIKRIRSDKGAGEIDTLDKVEAIYKRLRSIA